VLSNGFFNDVSRYDGEVALEGETLADRLAKGPLPLEQVLKYGIEISEGLERVSRLQVT
jgi:hypothetical protein